MGNKLQNKNEHSEKLIQNDSDSLETNSIFYTRYWKRILRQYLVEASNLEVKATRAKYRKEKVIKARKSEIEKFQ